MMLRALAYTCGLVLGMAGGLYRGDDVYLLLTKRSWADSISGPPMSPGEMMITPVLYLVVGALLGLSAVRLGDLVFAFLQRRRSVDRRMK